MKCAKCGEEPRSCRIDATCELPPVEGYQSPCLLKAMRSEGGLENSGRLPISKARHRKPRKERKPHAHESVRSSAG